jgi:hypothetical protein
MNRLRTHGMAEIVTAAWTWIPGHMREMLRDVHFFTEADPVFAGLTRWTDTNDGRSYRDTAHYLHCYHQTQMSARHRAPTVVLPQGRATSLGTVVHELGHALHDQLGNEWVAKPVNKYAETNWCEAFACAFAAWALIGRKAYAADRKRLYRTDLNTVKYLESIAGEAP